MTKEEFFEIVRKNAECQALPMCKNISCVECPFDSYDCYEEAFYLMLRAYDKLKEKMKWICINDKHPDIGEDVLVSVDTAESGNCWVTIAYMCHDLTDDEYWFQNDDMRFEMDEVFAWMPLPEPYEVMSNEAY